MLLWAICISLRSVCPGPVPTLNQVFFFIFCYCVIGVFYRYTMAIDILSDVYDWQIFTPTLWLTFYSLGGVL